MTRRWWTIGILGQVDAVLDRSEVARHVRPAPHYAFEVVRRGHHGGGTCEVLATLSGDYSCVIGVAGSDIMRAVTLKNDANDRFLAILTPAETASLALGTYLVGIELRNAALDPPLVSEIQYRITIVPEVVPASFEPTPGLAADGLLDFSKASQSGLLALFMEDF